MKKTPLLLLVAFAVSFWGCRPDGPVYIDDFDMVVTNYNENTNFGAKNTYALSDSIIKLFTADYSDPDGDNLPDFVNPTVSASIISKVDANMKALGYTKVMAYQNPDITFLLSVMQSTTIYYTYDYWYWSWYYPYYPYYPYSPTVVASSKSGTLLMQMLSNGDKNDDDRVPIVWNGLFNGLLEGSNADINSRINKSIDQAFKQSPYLKH